eukprot:scaffold7334_cov64-Phaeocystis_antarctica.AAC.12
MGQREQVMIGLVARVVKEHAHEKDEQAGGAGGAGGQQQEHVAPPAREKLLGERGRYRVGIGAHPARRHGDDAQLRA